MRNQRKKTMTTKTQTGDLPSIDSESLKKHAAAYKYAMDKTIQELEQAVEGMYHNLNY